MIGRLDSALKETVKLNVPPSEVVTSLIDKCVASSLVIDSVAESLGGSAIVMLAAVVRLSMVTTTVSSSSTAMSSSTGMLIVADNVLAGIVTLPDSAVKSDPLVAVPLTK